MNPTTRARTLPPPLRDLLERRLSSEEIDLPLLPTTAAQVLAASNEEHCEARRLAELIQNDQSLAAHVLRVANSAAHAPKEPITSLQQAVSRLGLATICQIALAVSMKARVFNVPGFNVKVRDMWIHSAMTACYAREVARLKRQNVEGLFMCGLMHDVGRPIVLETLVDILREKTEQEIPFELLESGMFEFHPRIGVSLVEHWGLPGWLKTPILFHHDYEVAEELEIETRIVYLANLLAHWATKDRASEDDFDVTLDVLSDLHLSDEDLRFLLSRRGDVLEVTEAFA